MKYIEIKILTDKNGLEIIPAALSAIGIDDVELYDPDEIFSMISSPESTEWYDETQVPQIDDKGHSVTVYLPDDKAGIETASAIQRLVKELSSKAASGEFGDGVTLGGLLCTAVTKDDSLWRDKWKEYFKPKRIAERIVVKPTWEEYSPEEGDIVVEIDPGMAFRTGTHETTSLSVKMLEKYVKQENKVLDVGTGSGILAVVSVLLGADDVLGIDIDEDAVRTANENIELNSCGSKARAVKGDLTKGVEYKADIVVANLLADLVMMLTESAGNHLKKNGIFISSGILIEKSEGVRACLEANGFEIIERMDDGVWCSFAARKLD